MSITKKMLSMLAFAAISLASCSDDKTDSNPLDPNGGPTGDNNFEIVASPHTITAKLQTKKYVHDENFDGWKLVPWEGGTGKIVASLGVDKDITEANVAEDGSFTMTLPGTLKSPFIIQYVDLAGGLTPNPKYFLTTYIPVNIFFFYPTDNPATPDINESEINQRMVSPKVINEADLSVIQRFGYTMSQDATITGTSTNGKVKYNSTFKKGWNIEAWKDVNGVSEYSVVGSLPAEVVWF